MLYKCSSKKLPRLTSLSHHPCLTQTLPHYYTANIFKYLIPNINTSSKNAHKCTGNVCKPGAKVSTHKPFLPTIHQADQVYWRCASASFIAPVSLQESLRLLLCASAESVTFAMLITANVLDGSHCVCFALDALRSCHRGVESNSLQVL